MKKIVKPKATKNKKTKSVKTLSRDVEKTYSRKELIEKLKRFADFLSRGKDFNIQIAGERIYVPKSAIVNIEHERDGKNEEIEFQIKWTTK